MTAWLTRGPSMSARGERREGTWAWLRGPSAGPSEGRRSWAAGWNRPALESRGGAGLQAKKGEEREHFPLYFVFFFLNHFQI